MNNDVDNSLKDYNTNNNFNNKKFSIIEMFILVLISVTVSLILGMLIGSHEQKNDNWKKTNDQYLKNFIENYEYIVDNYYENVDKEKLINNAIAGMMDSLDDPYSAYIDDDTANNFNISLQGSYEGLGVSIIKDPETNYIMAYTIFKNSPADKSGLKAGDLIKSIDGDSTKEKETSEFSNYILETDKKEFILTIIRGNEEFDITLKKENITIDSVTSKVIEQDNHKIGYIYISIFANNTAKQFKKQLDDLEKQNIDSLIIDVRSNTGGHLTAVEDILKSLLTTKQITYQLSQDSKITKYYGSLKKNKNYEIVLLGDNYSASASEVLISSLRENLGSKLIGVKTYGKGTVQDLVTLSNGVQYKITTKKWLTPNGNWINDTKGIEPDIEVKLDDKYYSTYDDKDDNQFQSAIKYLLDKK